MSHISNISTSLVRHMCCCLLLLNLKKLSIRIDFQENVRMSCRMDARHVFPSNIVSYNLIYMLERKRELQDELRHIACVSGYECRDLIMTNDIHLKEKKFDKQVTICCLELNECKCKSMYLKTPNYQLLSVIIIAVFWLRSSTAVNVIFPQIKRVFKFTLMFRKERLQVSINAVFK